MSQEVSLNVDLEIEVEISGTYQAGTPAGFSKSFGCPTEEEPDEIEDLCVCLLKTKKVAKDGKIVEVTERLDITKFISESDMEGFSETLIGEAEQ